MSDPSRTHRERRICGRSRETLVCASPEAPPGEKRARRADFFPRSAIRRDACAPTTSGREWRFLLAIAPPPPFVARMRGFLPADEVVWSTNEAVVLINKMVL